MSSFRFRSNVVVPMRPLMSNDAQLYETIWFTSCQPLVLETTLALDEQLDGQKSSLELDELRHSGSNPSTSEC